MGLMGAGASIGWGMSVALSDAARAILDAPTFATVATVNPDGSPQTSVVWVKRDGDAVLFSTTTARWKSRNIARDPRVSLSAFHPDDPYQYVEIRGRAEQAPDPSKALPRELSLKYRGEDPPFEPAEVERVIVRVIPDKLVEFSV
jgi:PPOX class probable F420-dependent enzyme